jgi:cytochrome P450
MIAPIDVAQPELFAEDRWQEPFRTLREQAPVQFVPDSRLGPYWSVTTYKPIAQVEALPKIFSSSCEQGGITLGARPDALRPGERRLPQFIAMDPPRHTAQRRTVAPASCMITGG